MSCWKSFFIQKFQRVKRTSNRAELFSVRRTVIWLVIIKKKKVIYGQAWSPMSWIDMAEVKKKKSEKELSFFFYHVFKLFFLKFLHYIIFFSFFFWIRINSELDRLNESAYIRQDGDTRQQKSQRYRSIPTCYSLFSN